MSPVFCLGLMSGTSMNGVDAAVCEFRDSRLVGIRGTATRNYPAALRRRLLQVARAQPALTLSELCVLDAHIAENFAQAGRIALKSAKLQAQQIRAVGSHGQTLFHAPDSKPATTLQLGDPNRISVLLGITAVADFRRRDLALGGQGAPLAPAFHQAQFAHAKEPRAVVNIGGIANLTVLPGKAQGVFGFDTGPGNGLMDEWIHCHHNRSHDTDGRWAARGNVVPQLLDRLLAHPYFKRRPPKSTGRGDFHLEACQTLFPGLKRLPPTDVQRTFCEFTAWSIADAVLRHAPRSKRVLICGGGARNRFLMSRIQALLKPRFVEPTDAHGVDANWVEAAAFAWLALRTLQGRSGNLPAVTGAHTDAILGGIYPI